MNESTVVQRCEMIRLVNDLIKVMASLEANFAKLPSCKDAKSTIKNSRSVSKRHRPKSTDANEQNQRSHRVLAVYRPRTIQNQGCPQNQPSKAIKNRKKSPAAPSPKKQRNKSPAHPTIYVTAPLRPKSPNKASMCPMPVKRPSRPNSGKKTRPKSKDSSQVHSGMSSMQHFYPRELPRYISAADMTGPPGCVKFCPPKGLKTIKIQKKTLKIRKVTLKKTGRKKPGKKGGKKSSRQNNCGC